MVTRDYIEVGANPQDLEAAHQREAAVLSQDPIERGELFRILREAALAA